MLNGKIIVISSRPAANHNIVSLNIASIFKKYLKGKSCMVFSEGMDVYLTEKDKVIPDVIIVCDRDNIKKNRVHGVPDLIVEILSPSTAKKDKGYKKDIYEKYGVKEYWIVDTDSRSIEVYSIFPDYLIEKMTEEEKDSILYEFKVSLY